MAENETAGTVYYLLSDGYGSGFDTVIRVQGLDPEKWDHGAWVDAPWAYEYIEGLSNDAVAKKVARRKPSRSARKALCLSGWIGAQPVGLELDEPIQS